MGIIAVSTPKDGTPLTTNSRVITRQQRSKVNELVKDKGVPIFQYIGQPEKGLASVIYKPIIQLQTPYTLPVELCSDLLWQSGWIFSKLDRPRPNWSGFMQHILSDEKHLTSKSEVLLLPIIDLNPSDESCVYSTLVYIQSQAEKLNIPTPCITFDQPLWLKAMEIIRAKSMNIVCRLGGFHTMMSFMGSIGSMKGSGLEEALQRAYGPNAVTHMISGKAVSRALCGHFLVEAALVNKLMAAILPSKQNEYEMSNLNDIEAGDLESLHTDDKIHQSSFDMHDDEIETIDGEIDIDMAADLDIGDILDAADVKKIHDMYEGIKDKSKSVASIAESQELMKLEESLLKYKALLAERSPTAKLWLQYIEYVET